MEFNIYPANNRSSIKWAGGTSTEIFIYPSDGSFVDRNFIFRISTATVEAEESTFTFFEGVTRHLMILKGELELIHEGRYTKFLKAYDQDTFSGEWSTKSRGKVTDFNLMLKGNATGVLKHITIPFGKKHCFNRTHDFDFLYIAEGQLSFENIGIARSGDLVEIEKKQLYTGIAEENCEVIEIGVNI